MKMRRQSVDVSVVVTNHNYGKLIRRCIRSLLNQDFPTSKYEILVIDDCSKDDSVEAVDSFVRENEIKLIQNEKKLGKTVFF